jgi:hypothetical protein
MTQKNRHCEAHSAAAIFPVNGDCFAAARAFAPLTGWAPLAMTQKHRHCEARSAAAIFQLRQDCFASLAMTPDKGNDPETPSLRGTQCRGNLPIKARLLRFARNDA